MEFVSVLVAALGGFATGAVWYMALAKPWMAAIGKTQEECETGGGSKVPFIVSGIAMLLVAGMMRHVFARAGITGVMEGAVAGLGVGLFFIAPWTAMNYAFAQRPTALTVIDGGYAVVGAMVIGAILGLI